MSPSANKLSLYIHIPFCAVRCGYCAFNTYTDLEHLIPDYISALCRELIFAGEKAGDKRVHTVYFGGGSPSLLSARQLEEVVCQVSQHFCLESDAEISLEANPNDLSEPYLRSLRRIGFNRLSIGMQSANAAILKMFDRRHDMAAVAAAVRFARRAGFDNVNLDVIFGSPGETLADWKETIQSALGLSPEHFSVYGLELKGGTRLRQQVDAGEQPRPDDDVFADMYEFASAALDEAGYDQYEISNWRLPAKECRHNLQYWRNLDYLGAGAGAHGFYAGCRYSTIASPQRYIAALRDGGDDRAQVCLTPAVAKASRVSEADDLYETIMMGMRLTEEGVNRGRFRRRFGRDLVDMFPATTRKLMAAGLIDVTMERVCLSEAGRLLSNLVIREYVDGISE